MTEPTVHNDEAPHTPLPPGAITEQDAARFLSLSVSFLRKARRFGNGPSFSRAGRAVRYTLSDLLEWLDANRVRRSA